MPMDIKRILKQTGFLTLLLASSFAIGATPIRAQEQDAPPPPDAQGQMGNPSGNGDFDTPDAGQDPPTRVARLSYIEGTVSFQPGGQGDWGAATRNRPVTVGDKIWSDNNSRVELQAGQASIRLSSMTALSFLNLDEQTIQMRLAEGSINFRVREMREGDVYEVDTPNVVFNVTQAGAFRIDVNENGDGTRVTVIRGEGQVIASGQSYTIHNNERGEFNGTDDVTYLVHAAPPPDDFDQWANQRDLRDDNSTSAKYVSREVPGYSDLDDNGTWNEEPDHGPVWYPNQVNVGWAPYSNGYWSYVGPWGWTWVDYAPWGFAPFHYGRWSYIGSRWGWCPGPYYARPIYGPAFVGFIGGSHWGVGFGFGGGIGWFPLGFREPYHPWYHASNAYYRNVNMHNTVIRNTTIINNRSNTFNYAYARNTRAVTVASRNNFVNGERINRNAYHVTDASLRGAQVSNRTNFTPSHQSYFGAAGARGNVARPSAAIQNRAVVARTAPAVAASHMPVRTFGGANNAQGRGGFNSASNPQSRGSFNNGNVGSSTQRPANNPASGRNTQSGVNANGNRPTFQQNAANNSGMNSRQRELATDKPQSHMRNAPADSSSNNGARAQNQAGNGNNTRTWSAQGNTTDRGRAPQGIGGNSQRTQVPRNTSMNHADRPAWADSGNASGNNNYANRNANNRPNDSNSNSGGNRSYQAPQRNSGYAADRPANANRGGAQPRSYNPPQRNYSQPTNAQPRSYNPPQRNYSQPMNAQPRSYNPPQRTYSPPSNSQPRTLSAPPQRSAPAPSRGSSGPSRSSGGGGGSNHGGGGGGGGSRSGSSPHGRR